MSEQMKNNKYNRTGPGSNQTVFSMIADDKEIQETVNAEKKKKKATFDMDADLHRRLRRYAVDYDTTMITIVEKALNEFLEKEQ